MSVRQNLISACLLILSASLTTPVYARSVTDHLNRTVEVPDHIERVAVADIFRTLLPLVYIWEAAARSLPCIRAA